MIDPPKMLFLEQHAPLLVVHPCATDGASCAVAVQPSGSSALSDLLQALGRCRRLQPVGEHVTVVCRPHHATQLVSWAAGQGLPSTAVLPVDEAAWPSELGLHTGVVAATAHNEMLSCMFVVAADASYVLEPDSSLATLLESAVVRGCDVLTFTDPLPDPAGSSLTSRVPRVRCEYNASGSTARAMILEGHESTLPSTSAVASGCSGGSHNGSNATSDAAQPWHLLGPVCVLTPASVAALSCNPVVDYGAATLASMLLGRAGPAGVHAVKLPLALPLTGVAAQKLAHAFLNHYHNLQRTALRELQAVNNDCEHIASAPLDALIAALAAAGPPRTPSAARSQLLAMLGAADSRAVGSTGSCGRGVGSDDTMPDYQHGCRGAAHRVLVDVLQQYSTAGMQCALQRSTGRNYSELPARCVGTSSSS